MALGDLLPRIEKISETMHEVLIDKIASPGKDGSRAYAVAILAGGFRQNVCRIGNDGNIEAMTWMLPLFL